MSAAGLGFQPLSPKEPPTGGTTATAAAEGDSSHPCGVSQELRDSAKIKGGGDCFFVGGGG